MRTLNETETESEVNAGDHTESLKTLDEKAITDEKLVNTVKERLANLKQIEQGIDDSVEDEDVTETPIPDVPDDTIVKDDEQAAVEVDPDEDDTDVDSQDGTVTIPDAFVRAAIHHGWKQEDVDGLIEQNPELALTTLTSLYNSTNNASKEWSAIGRAKIERERAVAEVQTAEQAPSPNITSAEAKKLREDYGDNPVVEKLIADAERVVTKPVTNVQQPADLYQTATARANAAANASVDTRVNTFFNSNSMSPYKEYYGEMGLSQSVNDLTNGQQEHRLAVLQEAEFIMAGLRMHGVDPTIEEVMEKAHLIVTEPIREQVIRNGLKNSAVARAKGKTLRPAKSKKSGAITSANSQQKPRNRQELISKVQQNLDRVLNN